MDVLAVLETQLQESAYPLKISITDDVLWFKDVFKFYWKLFSVYVIFS